jgi:transposase
MTKVKTNFSYHKVDVGLDVHKRSWNAAVFLDGVYVRNIHQPPSPKALHTFLTTYFPGADYRCAYECGKFGFWIQGEFSQLNIDCLVVNSADIPVPTKTKYIKMIAEMHVALVMRLPKVS